MSDKKDFFSKSFNKNKKDTSSILPLSARSDDSYLAKTPEAIVNETVKEIHSGELSRLTLDIPTELHRRIKIRATEKGMSMKDYAQSLFEKDLISEG